MKFAKLCTIILFLLLICHFASAAIIGVSPGNIDFKNMLRGGYAEETMRIYSDGKKPIVLSFEDFNTTKVSEWVTIRDLSNNTVITPNSSYPISSKEFSVQVEINLPNDIPNGNYKTRLVINFVDNTEVTGITAMKIISRVAAEFDISVVDQEIKKCTVKSQKISSVEKGNPLTFSFFMWNQGNVILNPTIYIDIWDSNQKNIVNSIEYDKASFKPSVYEKHVAEFSSSNLDPGQYWAEIRIPDCSDKTDLISFDILEPGEITSKGRIIEIKHKTKNGVTENIEFQIVFENNGVNNVLAQFKGGIWLDDTLIETIQSDEIRVAAGSKEILYAYFKPKKQGEYQIKGRVHYDKKQTPDKNSVFFVFPKDVYEQYYGKIENTDKKSKSDLDSYWLYIIGLGIFILLFLILIKKKKQKYSYYQ